MEWAALEGRWMDERLTALRLPFRPPHHSLIPLHTAQPRNFSALTVRHKNFPQQSREFAPREVNPEALKKKPHRSLFNQTNGYLNENNTRTRRVRIRDGKNAFVVVTDMCLSKADTDI